MRQRAAVLAFVVVFAALPAFPCGKIEDSHFIITHLCGYDTPCLEGEPIRFTVVADTDCYGGVPCAPYTFSACDIVEWDFGDGKTEVVQGSNIVTHTFATAGVYDVYATVRNPGGEQRTGLWHPIARKPPSFVHWSADPYPAQETAGKVDVVLERDGDTTRPVTLKLQTGGGGSGWDGRLERLDTMITIPAGESSLTIPVQLRNNDVYDGETQHIICVFCLNGDAVMPQYLFSACSFVRILDDDPGPTAKIASVRVKEGDAVKVKIPIELSSPLPADLPIFWFVTDGTATHGSDYLSESGEVVTETCIIPAGKRSGALEVTILGDTAVEDEETFTIRLYGSLLGPPITFTENPITVTIVDDDQYGLHSPSPVVTKGSKVPMGVVSARPAAQRLDVVVSSTDANIVRVPPVVTIPAGETGASFEAVAEGRGEALVTATFPGGESFSEPLTVVEEEVPVVVITIIEPSSGPTVGGTDVTIKGHGFSEQCTVGFDRAVAVGRFVDANTIRAVTPPHPSGAADVVVDCPGRVARAKGAFVYKATRRRSVR